MSEIADNIEIDLYIDKTIIDMEIHPPPVNHDRRNFVVGSLISLFLLILIIFFKKLIL